MERDQEEVSSVRSWTIALLLLGCFVLCCLGFLWCFIRRWMSFFNSEDESGCNTTRSSLARFADITPRLPTFPWKSIDAQEREKEVARNEGMNEVECVICLCEIEKEQMVRLLPKCSHVFHVECIDSWICSHFSCPLCRTPLNDIPISSESCSLSSTVSIHISNL